MGSDDEESVDVVFVYIKQSAMWSLIISYILSAISYWGIFHKAGRPGWPAIIPFYNYIVLLSILDKPCWWLLLMFLPLIDLCVHVIVMCGLGDCFDRSAGFKLGLIFLPTIFLLIVAFDYSQYTAPPTIQIGLYPRL